MEIEELEEEEELEVDEETLEELVETLEELEEEEDEDEVVVARESTLIPTIAQLTEASIVQLIVTEVSPASVLP